MCRHHLATIKGKDPDTAEELRPYAEGTLIRGLCDVDVSRAEKYKETYGGDYATDDPEKIFADPDIDAVLPSQNRSAWLCEGRRQDPIPAQ